MLILDILSSFTIAVAFFTIIPAPKLDWTQRRMKLVPLMMPLVGLVIGFLSFGLFSLLAALEFSPFLKAALMCLFYAAVTGGLHLDGLMDSADAFFSRREKEKKLEIMRDSSVGAFAVLTLFFVLLLKAAVFFELFSQTGEKNVVLIFIPVVSRIFQSSMLYLFPHARSNGLTKAFGQLDKRFSLILFALLLAAAITLCAFFGLNSVLIIVVPLAFYALFYFSSKKQFGGVTGDLLGAFLEISELLMFTVLLFI